MRDLGRLTLHGLLLALVAGAFWRWSPGVLGRTLGPTTAEQIGYGFSKLTLEPAYDSLVLGNSRLYRGVNPERMPGRVFNFAHDGDSFNQAYYKLLYLEERGRLPRRVILAVDYFSFSSLDPGRLELYRPYFPPRFALDYRPQQPRWGEQLNSRANLWLDQHFSQPFPLFCQALLAPPDSPQRSLSPSGQYRVVSGPGPYLHSPYDPVRRDGRRLPLLQDYFEQTLDLCHRSGLAVALVMAPVNCFERDAYPEQTRREFWSYIKSAAGGARVLDFESDRDFSLADFDDYTHLKLAAADRFSERLGARLEGLGSPR